MHRWYFLCSNRRLHGDALLLRQSTARQRSVIMAVVGIRVVRVTVIHRFMPVAMRVRPFHRRLMRVQMVLVVVRMQVLVFQH